MPVAIITGAAGQVGSFLAKHLLSLGYDIIGVDKTVYNTANLDFHGITDNIKLYPGDITNKIEMTELIRHFKPTEIYNLGAVADSPTAWDTPIYVSEVNALGVSKLLEAIVATDKSIKFFQATSSEIFGKATESPQNETTRFCPRGPYAVAKAFGHEITVSYREHYNLFAVSGILFNNESEIRPRKFVTRKITSSVAEIKSGFKKKLYLGNLESKKDWGFCGDYVRAIHMMLQQEDPTDYVIGSGKAHSVVQFCEKAFSHAGLDYKDYVEVNMDFYRPTDAITLVADLFFVNKQLGWFPEVSFDELVERMVDYDLKLLEDKK